MNILIIGGGGREHAIAGAYLKSRKIKKIIIAPGNDLIRLMSSKIKVFTDIKALDFEKLSDLAKKEKIDLVDIAQDEPLAEGFVDKFQREHFLTFGPTQKAAEIEWNKEWARGFMKKYKLPIPQFKSFNNEREAISYVKKLKNQTLYIKASGLALGKGAIRAENKEEAISAIHSMKQFGKAGETFLIEECLEGEEFSAFAVCDGKNYKILGFAQDHKRVFAGDFGPNTGGMGAVSNPGIITVKIRQEIEKNILTPFTKGMKKEGRPYSGILYLGGMVTKNGVKIIEFNSRWGDPEAEVLIPGILTDYLTIVESTIKRQLGKLKIVRDLLFRISVAGASLGYPNDYSNVKGKKVFGLEKTEKTLGVRLFGAGVSKKDKNFVVNGGRVFHIMAEGKTLIQARTKAYGAISNIYIEGNNLHYRNDIGWRDMMRIYAND